MGMCGGGGDSGGDELRRQEEERQARIRAGTSRVNQIFGGKVIRQEPIFSARPMFTQGQNHTGAPIKRWSDAATRLVQTGTRDVVSEVPGQFTDDYFTRLENEYNDFYMPQLQRQEKRADRNLKINLARSGNLGGSVGARKIGELEEDKETARRGVIDTGIKYGMDARKKIEDTRANLISQLESGAGIENVANQANAAAEAATAPPAFSPLGQLFSQYASTLGNATIAAGNPGAFPGADNLRRSLLFNIPSPGGRNSSVTVN